MFFFYFWFLFRQYVPYPVHGLPFDLDVCVSSVVVSFFFSLFPPDGRTSELTGTHSRNLNSFGTFRIDVGSLLFVAHHILYVNAINLAKYSPFIKK